METRVDEIAVMEGRVLVRYPLTREMLRSDDDGPAPPWPLPPGDASEVGKIAELEMDWIMEDEWEDSPFAANDAWTAVRHVAFPGWVQAVRLRL